MSVSVAPDTSTVPAAMWPGAAWPGDPIADAPPEPAAVVFSLGVPGFQWATGSPYLS